MIDILLISNNNFKSIESKKSINGLYQNKNSKNILINKRVKENIHKRSVSQINNKLKNNEIITSNNYINNINIGKFYSPKNISTKNKNNPTLIRNIYINNNINTEDSNYYINYL